MHLGYGGGGGPARGHGIRGAGIGFFYLQYLNKNGGKNSGTVLGRTQY